MNATSVVIHHTTVSKIIRKLL